MIAIKCFSVIILLVFYMHLSQQGVLKDRFAYYFEIYD